MPLTKDPAEIITVTFYFSSDATAVSNPAVSIDVVAGKLDPSASAMLVGAAQVEGTNVLQRVDAGLAGNTYKLRCVADDEDGERFVRADTLEVRIA